MANTCYDCKYCIAWHGQIRCGRCDNSYKHVKPFDKACDNFEQYEEDDEWD